MRRSWVAAVLAIVLISTVLPVSTVAVDDAEPFPWPPTPWLSEPEEAAEPVQVAERPPEALIVRKGRAATGAVALTFDDGYDSAACASIADTLRANKVTGTFFINGNLLKAKPAKWRRILEGMPVGNHTRSHRDLTGESDRVVRKQINENEALHERILGRPMLKVLRPPYGAHDRRVRRLAAELGYQHTVLWNVDTFDWKPSATAASIISRATGAPPGSIILMHCGPRATVKALPKIIRHYERRGIELAGLSVVLKGAKGTQRSGGSTRYGG